MKTNFNTYKLFTNIKQFPNKVANGTRELVTRYKEAKISRYADLSSMNKYTEAYTQIYNMRQPIASLAKKNNLRLKFVEDVDMTTGNDIIQIHAIDRKNPKRASKITLENTPNAIYHNYAEDYKIYNIQGEDTQRAVKYTKLHSEDNFLKNIFRKIDTLIKK